MEAVRQDCPGHFLPDRTLIEALLIGGGTLAEFCECVAVSVASHVDDSDYGSLAAYDSKMMTSRKFCLAVSMKNK